MASVTATNCPGSPASGSTTAVSRAAPHPASHSPAISSALTTTPPSTTCEASAIAKSCGSARGAASDSPSAASDRYERGVDTASRTNR